MIQVFARSDTKFIRKPIIACLLVHIRIVDRLPACLKYAYAFNLMVAVLRGQDAQGYHDIT